MSELFIVGIAAVSVAAILISLRQQPGYLRYPFLCGAIYLAWILPQLVGLRKDVTVPEAGMEWLLVSAILCLSASLIGWRMGLKRTPSVARRDARGLAPNALLWPVAVLTCFMIVMQVLIGLQPEEARQQAQWSGPLTILAFFSNLAVLSLYLSLFIFLRERSFSAAVLAGINVVIVGTAAFIALRRGVMVDFGFAFVAALWFGLRKRAPLALVIAGILVTATVTYAILPLRIAAKQIERDTGRSMGLFDLDVIKRVDLIGEVENAADAAVDLANAVRVIDYSNKWGEFTYGKQSWDAVVFQYVPAQILGVQFKQSLMFNEGRDTEQIQAEYGYSAIGGTTITGFGFSYQEFGLFGCVYFWIIGLIMGRVWSQAEIGNVWAQGLYASFAGAALLSFTHHAMWLIIKMPLFTMAIWSLMKLSELFMPHRSLTRA